MPCRIRSLISGTAVHARSPSFRWRERRWLPDVPTMSESIAGLEVSTWSGVGVPSGTPADMIERLNREINAGLADAGLRARFAEVGAVPLQLTPDELRARITRDVEKWAKVTKLAGIEPY